MSKDKMQTAFDEFEKEKYSNAEDIIRGVVKQAVNDHLKDKLSLKADPIISPAKDGDN